jgi:hypothetical protein
MRHVDRLRDREGRRVLDHPAGIARRKLDVRNDRIARVFRVEFTVETAAEGLILAGISEGLPLIGWRLALYDYDARHAGVQSGTTEHGITEKRGGEDWAVDHV